MGSLNSVHIFPPEPQCEPQPCEQDYDIDSPQEILGYIAMAVALVGIVGQWNAIGTGEKVNFDNYSIIFLLASIGTEILFFIQGLELKNSSILLSRAGTTIYYLVFTIKYLIWYFDESGDNYIKTWWHSDGQPKGWTPVLDWFWGFFYDKNNIPRTYAKIDKSKYPTKFGKRVKGRGKGKVKGRRRGK